MASELRDRARRLLLAGLSGAVAVSVLCVAGFALGGGSGAAATALISAATVVAFCALGQWVQVRVADSPPKIVLVAALASYTARVTVLSFVLVVFLSQRDAFPWIDAPAAVVTTVLVVHGWLLAEFWAFRKLRIPAFDPPHTAGDRASGVCDVDRRDC
jgi:ATP synthase protein I